MGSRPSVSARRIRPVPLSPPTISGTYSRISEEVSRPYHFTLDPAALRMDYLALKISSSRELSSVLVVTVLWMMQNLKVPTVDPP